MQPTVFAGQVSGILAVIHWAGATVWHSFRWDTQALARGIKDGVKAAVRSLNPGPRTEQPGTGEERNALKECVACIIAFKGLIKHLKNSHSLLK